MKKNTIWGGGLILGIAVVVAFTLPTKDQETITLGGAFGLTGFASSWGEADLNGTLLAIEDLEAEGKTVKLLVEDTLSDNKNTLSAVEKLLSIHSVDAIIGATWMDSFTSPAPLSESRDVIMISPSASITAVEQEQNFPNIFSTWYRSDLEMQAIVMYLEEQGVKKIAIIHSVDSFWEDGFSNFKKGLYTTSMELVAIEKVDPTSKDMRTTLTKLSSYDLDAIVFGFSSEENLFSFLNQRSQLLNDVSLITTEAFGEFVGVEKFGGLVDGIEFIAPKVLESDFNERYRKRFGIDPVFSASNSYDATKILVGALLNSDGSTQEVREYLNTHEFDTITFGKTRFDEIGGVTGGDFVIKKVVDGKAVVIEEL